MGGLGLPELIIIGIIVLLMFSGKKLPELGAGLDGRWLDLLGQSCQCASVGGELQITLPPYQVFWGRQEATSDKR